MVVDGPVRQLTTADPTRALHVLTGWALDHGVELSDLAVHRPSLEDVYLELVERAAPREPAGAAAPAAPVR
ncbi:hypothetical protein [Cellulomonas sp. ATA003]|uniref:hypothetical protein n=1 Tax=Cellulomonas sp. ATA003 TaxID=3073064 RepID=UPI002872DD74|nr:hypothetical protein [Cellulomonas sp. ATA003]WNB86966.1 hypothetical protein REH70_07390 [Cellulomonas sp. ATA003]